MRLIICISFLLITTTGIKAQLSRDDVKEVLLIQGYTTDNIDNAAKDLHQKYLDRISYQQDDLLKGLYNSAISGISMGARQSRLANYEYSNWLPGFVQQWWTEKHLTNMVFGETLTWGKVFRETDYIFDRSAYENLNRFFGDTWYYTIIADAFLKNLSASLIRHKFKYGSFF